MKMIERLFVAVPHGFCAGVKRAVLILEKCLEQYGAPIYVNHEIVHNEYLVKYFRDKGVVFGEDVDKIPGGAVMVLSAHGVLPDYKRKCEERGLRVIDASCPLVLRVHNQARGFAKSGHKIFLIGHKRHQEVMGTSGIAEMEVIEDMADVEAVDAEALKDFSVACLTQTTLSVDDTKDLIEALRVKIPHLEIKSGICYASQNRQDAVKKLAEFCDFVVVLGSRNSSNSNRLVEAAKSNGCDAMLVDDIENIPAEVYKYAKIGLTSGASVPETLLDQMIEKFKSKNKDLEMALIQVAEEDLEFPLPFMG